MLNHFPCLLEIQNVVIGGHGVWCLQGFGMAGKVGCQHLLAAILVFAN